VLNLSGRVVMKYSSRWPAFVLCLFSLYVPSLAFATIVSATLPSSRSVQVGQTATAFGTIINAGAETATNCGLALGTTVDASFSYQTTDPATNALTGTVDTPASIAAGESQSYIFSVTPNASFTSTDVTITFDCDNTDPAPVNTGLNTLLLSASDSPVPDVVALAAATLGIVDVTDENNIGAFAVASVNVGASATISVTADVGSADLPIAFLLCETDPTTAACTNPTVASASPVSLTIASDATPTFSIFVTSTGGVPFDPGANRVFVRFKDSDGVTRGSTSVAVRTVVLESALAMSGAVTTFPDAGADAPAALRRRGLAEADQSTFDQDDMEAAKALVSLYLLSDTGRTTPIATVKTATDGTYEIHVNDVEDYLLAEGLITAESTDEEILAAFQALGQLQVNALITEVEEDGTTSAMAIQTIADPTSTEVVAVNPIIHRVVKTILDQVAEAIGTLTELGLSTTVVDALTESIIDEIAEEIVVVLAEADLSEIDIPDGQTAQSVFEEMEEDFEVSLTAEEVASLDEIIESDTDLHSAEVAALEAIDVLEADEVKDETDVGASLDSESSGLLASLDNTITDALVDGVDTVAVDDYDTPEAAAAAAANKLVIETEALQKFFLAMGFSVVVAQDDATQTTVIVSALPTPPHIPEELLPGQRAFGERALRYFKLGTGTVSGDFAGAVTLEEEALTKLEGITDLVIDEILSKATPTPAEFELIDRLRLYHELLRRVEESPIISMELTQFLVENADATVRLKQIGAVIASNFEWSQELVNITDDGFPIYTDRVIPVKSGATVDASELVRFLSLRLDDSPGEAADHLTSQESFYAQFAPDAIEVELQHAFADGLGEVEFVQLLQSIYPETAEGYRDLILGNDLLDILPSPPYHHARDRVARGLTAAVPPALFGTSLTSETELGIRTAFFFVNYLMQSNFAVDETKGYFTDIDLAGVTRYRPNFENLKFLEPIDNDMSIAGFIAELLQSTEVEQSAAFDAVWQSIDQLLDTIPDLPEFQEQNIDDFAGQMTAAVDTVSASCAVERFDGLDPRDPFADGGAQHGLTVSLHPVQYNDQTGEFSKGDKIAELTEGAVTVDADGWTIVNYSFTNIPAVVDGQRGLDYVMRFNIPSYEHDIPEMYFWVDGYVADQVMCDVEWPWWIGPDEAFVPIPGLGLNADQVRWEPDGTTQTEGVDLSNFEVPGGMVYVTPTEEAAGHGIADFNLQSTETGYALTVLGANSTAGFAPLYGSFGSEGVAVTLTPTANDEPLFGIFTLLGANVRDAVDEVVNGAVALSSSVDLETDWELFEYDRLYLFRDNEGIYWVVEVRWMDVYEDFDGTESAFMDFGFAKVNNMGFVDLPEDAFDVGFDDGPMDMRFYWMVYGDWLILEPPTGWTGSDWQPPSIFDWGDTDYTPLSTATDGIVIRYAGEHFDDNITTIDSFDALFADGDYSSIPVRLDAVSSNVSFIKVSFDKQNRKYIMAPDPDNATPSVTNLEHGDIVAILDSTSVDGGPAYLARILQTMPATDPMANFEIAMDVIPFRPEQGDEGSEVACFNDDQIACPTDLPELFYETDLTLAQGVIYDRDYDGVPGVFDPNDEDPNVPGEESFGPAGGFHEGLFVTNVVESVNGTASRSILVKTEGLYPGDIDTVSVRNAALFGDELYHAIFSCEPPVFDQTTSATGGATFTGIQCTAATGLTGVEVVEDFVSFDQVGYRLVVADAVLDALGDPAWIDYMVTFILPVDPQGLPFMCGDEACPARPDLEDVAMVNIPAAADVAVFENATVAVGTETATALSETTSLEVSRDLTITASVVPLATDYELGIFCEGSDDFDQFLPDEHFSLWAPAYDEQGRAIAPEFLVGIQWLGGRTCDFELMAFLHNDAGEFMGISRVLFTDIVTTGGNEGFFDNEVKMLTGASACFVDGKVVTEDCLDTNTLFMLEGTTATQEPHVAHLMLGANVKEAFFEAWLMDLTSGRVDDTAVVSFNVDLADPASRPTCGSISTDQWSNFCPADTVLTDLLVREGAIMRLADGVTGLTITGDVNEDGLIPMDRFGYYFLVNANQEQILEFGIDAWEAEVWLWSRPRNEPQDFDSAVDEDRMFNVTNPGYLFVMLEGQAQPVDFDILGINDLGAKFAYYLPPPRLTLVGEHDLDADAVPELVVTQNGDLYTFTFAEGLIVQTWDPETGMLADITPDEATNVVTVDVNATVGWVEFQFSKNGVHFVFSAWDLGSSDPVAEYFQFEDFAPGADGTTTNGDDTAPADDPTTPPPI